MQGLEFGFSLSTGKNHDAKVLTEKIAGISMKALRESFHQAGIRLPDNSELPLTEWKPLPRQPSTLDFLPWDLELKQSE